MQPAQSNENASHYFKEGVKVDIRKVLKFSRAKGNEDPGVTCENPYPTVTGGLFTWLESNE